jgi:hypothetical protein
MGVENEHFVEEAERIVAQAEEQGVRLRILGSLAYRLHCPENLQLFEAMASNRCNLGASAFDSSNGALFEQFFCDSLASCFQFLDLDLCRRNDLIP